MKQFNGIKGLSMESDEKLKFGSSGGGMSGFGVGWFGTCAPVCFQGPVACATSQTTTGKPTRPTIWTVPGFQQLGGPHTPRKPKREHEGVEEKSISEPNGEFNRFAVGSNSDAPPPHRDVDKQ